MKIESYQINNPFLSVQEKKEAAEPNQAKFIDVWKSIGEMNEQQTSANTSMEQVLTGQSDDVHGALIALEKAEIQMQFATRVRDHLTQGYKEIINMQL